MPELDDYTNFRKQIGMVIVYSAISYSIFITILLVVWGKDATQVITLWSFLTNIISVVLGWLLAKAGSVLDHLYGSSLGSEEKSKFIMKQDDKYPPPPPETEVSQ